MTDDMNDENPSVELPLQDYLKDFPGCDPDDFDMEWAQKAANVLHMRTPDAVEFAQTRSNFQMEKFMGISDGMTMANTFAHIALNRRVMAEQLQARVTETVNYKREFEARWKDVPEDENFVLWGWTPETRAPYWRDTDQLAYNAHMLAMKIEVRDRTFQISFMDHMLAVLEERNGGKFTREQMLAEEPEYWSRRLSKQVAIEHLGRIMGVGTGNLQSAIMSGAPSILPDGLNIAPGMNILGDLLQNEELFERATDETSVLGITLRNALSGIGGPADPEVKKALNDMNEKRWAMIKERARRRALADVNKQEGAPDLGDTTTES